MKNEKKGFGSIFATCLLGTILIALLGFLYYLPVMWEEYSIRNLRSDITEEDEENENEPA